MSNCVITADKESVEGEKAGKGDKRCERVFRRVPPVLVGSWVGQSSGGKRLGDTRGIRCPKFATCEKCGSHCDASGLDSAAGLGC